MSLSPEEVVSYGAIIDDILANSNLTSVSAKQVRKQLAEKLGYDITDQKKAVNEIINERFDKLNNQQTGEDSTNGSAEAPPTTNGVVKSIEQVPTRRSSDTPARPGAERRADKTSLKRSAPDDDDDSELSELMDDPKPVKKRKHLPAEDDDAAFAARLQDEENRLARPTRGGNTRKRAPSKKDKAVSKKKKSAAKVKDEDDSDVQSGSEEKKEKKGGFHKPMLLSEPLSALVGETELSRPQTVKKVWEYIKGHDLQDPSDRRQIICDDMMLRVFKQDKVHMFTMNKILNQQLYPKDD